jgi:hypothetical protein
MGSRIDDPGRITIRVDENLVGILPGISCEQCHELGIDILPLAQVDSNALLQLVVIKEELISVSPDIMIDAEIGTVRNLNRHLGLSRRIERLGRHVLSSQLGKINNSTKQTGETRKVTRNWKNLPGFPLA